MAHCALHGPTNSDLSPGAKEKEAGQQSLIKIEAPVPGGRARLCAGTRRTFLAQVLSALLGFTWLPQTHTLSWEDA